MKYLFILLTFASCTKMPESLEGTYEINTDKVKFTYVWNDYEDADSVTYLNHGHLYLEKGGVGFSDINNDIDSLWWDENITIYNSFSGDIEIVGLGKTELIFNGSTWYGKGEKVVSENLTIIYEREMLLTKVD